MHRRFLRVSGGDIGADSTPPGGMATGSRLRIEDTEPSPGAGALRPLAGPASATGARIWHPRPSPGAIPLAG